MIKVLSWKKKLTSQAKLKSLQLELWLEPARLGHITNKYLVSQYVPPVLKIATFFCSKKSRQMRIQHIVIPFVIVAPTRKAFCISHCCQQCTIGWHFLKRCILIFMPIYFSIYYLQEILHLWCFPIFLDTWMWLVFNFCKINQIEGLNQRSEKDQKQN